MVNFCDTPINVLGFLQEDGEWAAVALELDVWGFGDTEEESIQELIEMVAMQIDFSGYKENPELLLHPAPAMYFHMHAQVSGNALRAKATHQKPEHDSFAGSMPFPEVSNSNGFAVVNG